MLIKHYYEIQEIMNSIVMYRVMERKSLEQKRKEFIDRIKKEKGNNASGNE